MRRPTTLGIVLAALVTGACAEMSLPTAPSPIVAVEGAPVGTGSVQSSLRWDLTASGCDPQRPAPQLLGPPTSIREMKEDEWQFRPGAVVAEWLRLTDLVYAVFYEEPDGHALCFWDIADI